MGSISPPSAGEEEDVSFPNLPPFPSDIPTVPLLRVSLSNILAGDVAEQDKLWRACCDLGFFYLDLRSSTTTPGNNDELSGPALLQSADELFSLADEIFSLPLEEKRKYSMVEQGSYFGYKGFGDFKDRKGVRDRNEFWNVSKDDVLGVGGEERMVESPEVLRREGVRESLRRYMVGSHGVVRVILGVLEGRLGLEDGTLQNLHRLHSISGDQVRWVRSPPQPPSDRQTALGEHTDFGSVTILFNRLGGLQVLPPNQSTWAYVKPLRGHCIVNLGDAMVKFTAGILRSNIHRVANPPGEQQGEVRDSLVYFSRPEDEVVLKVLEGSRMIEERKSVEGVEEDDGRVWTAKEWILNRALKRAPGTDRERLEKRDSGVEAGA